MKSFEEKADQLNGFVVIETDDLLGGGIGEKFHAAIEILRERFTFGKWVALQERATDYGGRTIKQLPNLGFNVSMVRYLRERARPIEIARGRMKTPNAEATEAETTRMRGLTGKLNWVAREGMPNGAGDASLLSATMPHPKVKDLAEANAALKRLKEAEATIWIKPIPLEKLKLLCFADSSLANAPGGSSQLAELVCAAHEDILIGKDADVSILVYHSHSMKRAGSSTLLVESNAMSSVLAECEWVASWFGLAKDLHL